MIQTQYLQVAIDELSDVINELRLQQQGQTDEVFVTDCLDKANFIIDNFLNENQIHSNDALDTSFDTVVREDLHNSMSKFD
tara:strand:- start:693 stop:935 length:243 start_codon:yes stop_codon:yes gene_type:complete